MSITNVFDIAGSAMSAQTLRLNTLASNIANAETVAESPDAAYKARYPIFKAVMDDVVEQSFRDGFSSDPGSIFSEARADSFDVTGGVNVDAIYHSEEPAETRYYPSHPMADEEGYVYLSNVNVVEEMADMISASRAFEMSAEVANTAKSMMQRLISLGR